MSLQKQLDALAAQVRTTLAAEWQAVLDRVTEDLRRSGLATRSLRVGDRVPPFALPNARGRMVHSGDLLAKRHLVVSFYRGGWWPFCRVELVALQQQLHEIEAAGASVVVISPELPGHVAATAEQTGVAFEVLSDHQNAVARQFGLVYQFPPDLVALYRDVFKNDLTLRNGTDTYELPVPATFLILRGGTIRLAFTDPDFTKRLEPADILRALRRLKAES